MRRLLPLPPGWNSTSWARVGPARRRRAEQDRGEGWAHRHSPSRGRPVYGIAGGNDGLAPLDIHVHRELEVGIVVSGRGGDPLLRSHPDLPPGRGLAVLPPTSPTGGASGRRTRRTRCCCSRRSSSGRSCSGGLPWMAMFVVPPSQRPQLHSPEARRQALALGRMLRQEIEEGPPDWEEVARVELLHLLRAAQAGVGGPAARRRPTGVLRSPRGVLPAVALSALHALAESERLWRRWPPAG